MAETDVTTNVIKVTEELDGDQIPTRNYRFSKIGEPVPIKPDTDFKFDMNSLPSRPLAVSERFGVIFVAHSSGFSVARMKDVMDAAEELKNGVQGSCIQELSVVDVSLGKVSILALSADSSMLAASVGLNLYFFSVEDLLNKDPKPSYSKSLNSSSNIKDMQWNPKLKDRYAVLTGDGSLYHGAGQGDLNHVTDNVDAVNWSTNGKYIAVAKYDFLSIMSTKFKEKLRIKLLFDSLVEDDPSCVVKVDSVRWVRSDCIMLGCYSLSADEKEENNLIQFISVKDAKITDPSSSPVALNFRDAFLAINEDDVPSRSGPYTFISYLDEFELAFVANKKNTNQHIVLFNWSEDGAVMVDIEVDSWLPTINLQAHNDDDNMILGLSINKDYKDEKISLECGEIETRVSPCCILMCITVDGRFCMFHFASAIGPSASTEDFSSVSDEEEESTVLSSQHSLKNIVNNEKQLEDQDIQKVKIDEQKAKANESSGTQEDASTVKSNNDKDGGQSLSLPKKENSFEARLFKATEPVSSTNSASKTVSDKPNKSLFVASTESPANKPPFSLRGSSAIFTSGPLFSSSVFGVQSSSGSFSSGGMFSSVSFDLKSLQSSHGVQSSSSLGSFSSGGLFSSKSFDMKSLQSSNSAVQEKQHGTDSLGTTPLLTGPQKLSFSNMTFGSSSSSSVLPQGASTGAAFTKSSPVASTLGSSTSTSLFAQGGATGATFGSSALSNLLPQGASTGATFTKSLPVATTLGSSTTSNLFAQGGATGATFGSSALSNLLPQGASTGAAFAKSLPVVSTFGSSTSSNLLSQGGASGATFGSSTSSNLLLQGASTRAASTKSLPVVSAFGSSASSNLFPQGASTGAVFTKSLPVVSNVQQNPAKTFDFKFSDKGNLKNPTSSRGLNTEPNQSEQHSVEEMAKELDALLDSIEEPGGFYHASVTAHKQSVAELEEGILILSDRCQKWTDKMHQGFEEVQHLLDKTVQVLARKIYIEAIVKQATDSQYLDIWSHQKLSSELDMKRRHILEINQTLTNQLIELERHLNTLELQRFGDKSDTQVSRKSSHMKHNPPRHVQSLHSLHNTMNAQLTAAEKLSECLSKQMAVLNIDTEPVKKQNVKKELFDTIGISYDDATFSSPGQEKTRSIPQKSQHLVSSYSTATKTNMKKNQQTAVKSSEPETARRRIDSLDKSWASVEPPKTTVKRMLLQEDRQLTPARLSLPTATPKLNTRLYERSVVSHDIPQSALNISQIRGSQDVQIKQNYEGQPSSSLFSGYRSDSSSFASRSNQLSSIVTRDAAKDTPSLTAEKSNRLTFALKPDDMLVKDPKVNQQSKVLEPSLNTTKSPAFNIFQKKPIEFSDSGGKINEGNQKPLVAETSSIWSRKSPETSVVLSASPSTAFSGKSFSLEASTRESQSSSASSPVPVTLAPSSFSFKDTSSSSTSAISLGKSSTGFRFKLGATQSTPASGPSLSFPSFSSSTSSSKPTSNVDLNTSKSESTKLNPVTSESSKPQVVSVPKFDPKPSENSFEQTLPQPVVPTSLGSTSQPSPSILSFPSITSSTKPTLNIDLNTSKSEPFKLNLDTSESSKPQAVSIPKFDLKPNENSSSQTLPSQPVVSTPLGPTSQPLTSSISESQLNLNSKPDQTLVPPVVSSTVITNPVDVVTQEDEMEEEAPDTTTQSTLGGFGGFGLGSSPNPSAHKQNPFGAPFGNAPAIAPAAFTAPPSGGLFKPASFSVESQQPSQPPQQTSFGAVSGNIFGGNNNQSSGGQGFGQPARIGSGQQALGSVLGSFGQSRQFGAGLPGTAATPSPFGGGFGGSQTAGGFATAASGGGGFASLASGGGGGFAAAAATGGGGFAAAATGGGGGFGGAATGAGGFTGAATGGGGFGGAATGGGGFGAAPAIGSGFGAPPAFGSGFGGAPAAGGGFGGASAAGGEFAGVASGGFGGFSSQAGSGFLTFGSSSSGGTGKPPSELFTQMRK
ncbi:nuclear pore complex protein NUP214-like [Bidens hawaiensis]|uniref:nuclear pore complex protein NUP214-like n=1 Tax=Bidens hawaiensis TaxID=980011 RepID=UPI00404AE869